MLDSYQQGMEFLTENPWLIRNAYMEINCSRGGCLFRYVSPDGHCSPDPPGGSGKCGCLVMIRNSFSGGTSYPNCVGWNELLTNAIAEDLRLPILPEDITVDHLPIFAGWQRRIDAILGRTAPPLDPRLPPPRGDIEIPAVSASAPREAATAKGN